MTETGDHLAMHVRSRVQRDTGFRGNQRRQNAVDKRQQYCEHCGRTGHTKETCFKIHGTPDWYKDMVEQRKKMVGAPGKHFAAHTEGRKQSQFQGDTKENLLHELVKLMRGTVEPHVPQQQVNFAQVDDFAGMNLTLDSYVDDVLGCWIVDTGATNHMCANPRLLTNLIASPNTSIHLSDGHIQNVSHTGDAHLHHNLTLTNIFLVPRFKYNLLSVPKLCTTAHIDIFSLYSLHISGPGE
ncbi:UNVERIFIED_CONTAM: hypothetical protein Scaly_1603600 [Sesamum calycinum]|uniref:Retrovirus-related Pol polyprotein from transposon TNT 1-94-like beta-barrel domain-containing protein n=1 Tax=Sesamum calycinum TaxID=2727403 RepID=A0AAW2PBK3_9LAMI